MLALLGERRPKACDALLGRYVPRSGREAPKALVSLHWECRPKAVFWPPKVVVVARGMRRSGFAGLRPAMRCSWNAVLRSMWSRLVNFLLICENELAAEKLVIVMISTDLVSSC